MALWISVCPKADGLSLILRTHMIEGESMLFWFTLCTVDTHTYILNKQIMVKILYIPVFQVN